MLEMREKRTVGEERSEGGEEGKGQSETTDNGVWEDVGGQSRNHDGNSSKQSREEPQVRTKIGRSPAAAAASRSWGSQDQPLTI